MVDHFDAIMNFDRSNFYPYKNTYDLKKYYMILSNGSNVIEMLKEKKINFEKVPDYFAYNSGTNSHFLSINELRNLIKQNIEPNFKPI